jgi:hypothetical protein
MSPVTKAVRVLFIAAAGVSTFYVAAQWSKRQQAPESTLALAVVRPAPGTGPSAAAASSADAPGPDADPLGIATDRKRSIAKSPGDLFGRLSWLPPPPPPPPPAPPAPPPKPPVPTAPPLPFTFVGMLERGADKPAAFLSKGDALFVVSVGDMVDNNTYRVDTLTANELVLTYLPLNTPQTLNVAARSK